MKLSCLQNFLWLQSLLCVFNRNVFEGKLLLYAPGWSVSCSGSLLHRHRGFAVAMRWDPRGVWAHPLFSCPVWWLGIISLCVSRAHCGGHCPEPSPDTPSERQGALDGAQLCTPQSFDFSVSTICVLPSQDMSRGSLPLPINPVNTPEFSYCMKTGYCIKFWFKNFHMVITINELFINFIERGSLQYSAESYPN